MSPFTASTASAPDAARNAASTKRLFYVTAVVAGLVLVPMTGLAVYSVHEMNAYPDDPWSGIGIFFAIIFSIPSVAGLIVSALALPWRTQAAGPVVATVGLAIAALSAFGVASMFLPAVPVMF